MKGARSRPNYFPCWAYPLVRGRAFSAVRKTGAAPHPSPIISYGLWQRAYGGALTRSAGRSSSKESLTPSLESRLQVSV